MRKLLALLLLVALPALAQQQINLTSQVRGILPVANGGTNAASASGTALDNISGFATTGFLTRAGAGAYSFQSTTNGITLGNIAQIGTNTILGNSTNGTANASALSIGGCSSASNALVWTTNTGFGCNSAITAAGLTATLVPASGGTGIANNNAATVTSSGNFTYTRTLTAATNVTFPTSGTLAVLGANTFTGLQTFNLGATVASGQTLTLTGATVAGAPTYTLAQPITLSTAAQPNVTSVGTLTSLGITSAVSGADVLTLTTANNIVSANLIKFSRNDGAVAGALQYYQPTNTFRFGSTNNFNVSIKVNDTDVGLFSPTGLAVTGAISTSGSTVAGLPAGTIGQRRYVTDALAPTFLGVLTGGGTVVTPVFYNGTAWVAD